LLILCYVYVLFFLFFFFCVLAPSEIYTLSLHDALPISLVEAVINALDAPADFPIGGRTLRQVLTDGVSLSPAPDMLFQLYSYLTDRKSTRLNSSHLGISYAVFCLKKKKKKKKHNKLSYK